MRKIKSSGKSFLEIKGRGKAYMISLEGNNLPRPDKNFPIKIGEKLDLDGQIVEVKELDIWHASVHLSTDTIGIMI